MKKLLFVAALSVNLLLACGQRDEKNEQEHYPTYDTLQRMEHINSPDSVSPGSQSIQGDMQYK